MASPCPTALPLAPLLFGSLLALLAPPAASSQRPASPSVDPFARVNAGDLTSEGSHFTGASWGDFNQDGLPDLFIARANQRPSRLYRNRGDGTFERITTGALVTTPADTHAGVWGDLENDGDLDLVVSNGSFLGAETNACYLNDGQGLFTQVEAGELTDRAGSSAALAWADYDRDGFLDLFIANFGGSTNWLYRNLRDRTFLRVTEGEVATDTGLAAGAAWVDWDNDGWIDLTLANGAHAPIYLYQNLGNGAFRRWLEGPLPKDEGSYWLGVDWGDCDNNGFPDLYMSAYNGLDGPCRVYLNQGAGQFVRLLGDPAQDAGPESLHPAWADYDNDGWLDVYVARGEQTPLRSRLYRNRGDGTFEEITQSVAVTDETFSASCAWADYDNDGFLDLVVARGGYYASAPNALFRNQGNPNTWLKIQCVGTASNRTAIGTKVRLLSRLGGRETWQLRTLSGGSGGGGQNTLVAHFGLADAPQADRVRIEWPSGLVQEFGPVAARQTLTVVEPPILFPSLTRIGTQIELHVQSWSGITFQVEASTDLSSWAELGPATVQDQRLAFTDPDAATAAQRLYRLRTP